MRSTSIWWGQNSLLLMVPFVCLSLADEDHDDDDQDDDLDDDEYDEDFDHHDDNDDGTEQSAANGSI